jgi:hypothetical protein
MADNFGLVFAKGITLNEVNPENFHLKNNYADNLITTCLMVFPFLDTRVSELFVTHGFISRKKLFNEIIEKDDKHSKVATAEQKKHCKGLALEVSWKGFDRDKATNIAREMFKELPYEKMKFVVTANSLGIYRKVNKRKIIHSFDDEMRIVFAE